jgi:hypothetical protein
MFSVSLREGAGIDACSIYDGLEPVVSVLIRDDLRSVRVRP